MKNFKIMLSVFMVLVIISISVAPSLAIAVDSITRDVVNRELATIIEKSDKDKKLPVYIWYSDISQEEIDIKVNEQTGLTLDTLSEDLVMPDTTLLNGIKNNSDEAESNMEAYLAKTKVIRDKEKRQTEEYVQTRRRLSRQAYSEKSEKIKGIAAISDSNIIFNSKYAPMIICELTTAQINQLNKDSRIVSIGYYEELTFSECTAESIKGTTGIYDTETKLGLTGDGVKVGMVELGCPDGHVELASAGINLIGVPDVREHATGTARILKGSVNGYSKGIELYSTNIDYSNIEMMLDRGVELINVSFSWKIDEYETGVTYAYSNRDKWFDHIVSNHNVTVVVSAGNLKESEEGVYERVTSPGMAHNVITVGAYNDRYNTNHSDDILNANSCFKNENGTLLSQGVEKPDVVMPCNTFDDQGGTSYATPVLTAMIAQMFELKPSLAVFPQAVKAIVMASCHRKVKSSTDGEPQERMGDGITERQGAGAPDAWTMACIVSQGTYGVGILEGSTSVGTHKFVLPKYGAENFNVSISWIRNNICNGSNTPVIGETADIDLYVYDKDNTIIGFSELEYSSTEMSYQELSSGDDSYEIRVEKYESNIEETLRYGYAYSTDSSYITPVTSEGIYRFKNKEMGKYLTYDFVASDLSLENANTGIQQWIVKNVNGYCGFYPNTNDSIGYLSPTVRNDETYYDIQFSSIVPVMLFQSYETNPALTEGYYTLITQGYNNSYALSHLANDVCFEKCSNTSICTNDMQWSVEKMHYRRGDADVDGTFDMDDVMAIQEYLSEMLVFDEKCKFLADANYDGEVSVLDVTKIQSVLAQLEIY